MQCPRNNYTADQLLQPTLFDSSHAHYQALIWCKEEVFEEVKKRISPELREKLSNDATLHEYESDSRQREKSLDMYSCVPYSVRYWDYQRQPLGYQFHISDKCHFCSIGGGGTKAYQFLMNDKWLPVCNCCSTEMAWKKPVPRPQCPCIFHSK